MTRNSTYHSVRILGGLLPSDLLERVGAQDSDLEGSLPVDYDLAPGERLGEAITRSWNRLQPLWERFTERADQTGALTGPTRQEWLLPLFQELGFGHLSAAPGFEVEGKAYPISHLWESTPIHLVGIGVELDRRTPGVAGAASVSPHGLMQEFLNRSDDHLWGIISNGYQLRLLRDNASLTRTAYVEFDLREMFEGDSYSDFALLWLTCHASRLDGPTGKEILERWREAAATRGIRALDALRIGVEAAIETLGSAAVSHPDNVSLRTQLDDGSLDAQDLYRQILRVVYRFLFLFVAEGRGLLLDPAADPAARIRYQRFYSITRLRELAAATRGGLHGDLWRQHSVVARALEATGEPALGLLPLGGFLWSAEATAALNHVTIPNEALLAAVRSLTMVKPPGELLQRVDYANLGAEELGSIYEALLEYIPEVNPVAGTFELKATAGNEKKTTGSYYTPTSLINEILNSALNPVLDEAAQSEEPEQAILDLKVVDPAAGSGHFLIAAANRIADRLARARAGDDEPSPDQLRTALRDVIGRCIYAVDINPMAIELAKVALWIEAMEPGKPLTFIDHHVVCGNSLLGATPEAIENGIPDSAFKPLSGDDRALVKILRARNREEREKGLSSLVFGNSPQFALQHTAAELIAIDELDSDTVSAIAEKQHRYERLSASPAHRHLRLAADAWVAAFVGNKTHESPEITTAVVNAATHDPEALPAYLVRQIDRIANHFRFHHWHIAFPSVFVAKAGDSRLPQQLAGFDVVLGNPPWERVKLQEKEFFASSSPDIAKAPNKAVRRRLIEALETRNPDLWEAFRGAMHDAEAVSHFLRASGIYPLCGRGDVNTYTVFAEAMRSIVNSSGRVGMIVPTGIATDDTTKHFFADLISRGSLVNLFDFENRKGLFPSVHRSQKFCLLTLAGTGRPVGEARFCFFALDTGDLADIDRQFTLSSEDFALLNPNTRTCPTFRSRRDAEITKSIYKRIPVLINETSDEGNLWGVTFLRMFDMSGDSELFWTREQLVAKGWNLTGNGFESEDERYLPLYEAKMTGFFDHRAADIVISATALVRQGQPRALSDSDHMDSSRLAQPRYWVRELDVRDRLPRHWEPEWLIGFRNVSSPTNERTIMPSPLPLSGVGHSFPLLLTETPSDAVSLLALLSSFVLDYVARQKVGGINMTYNLFQQFAVVAPIDLEVSARWDHEVTTRSWIATRVIELAATADDIATFGREPRADLRPYMWDRSRREALRCELDAAAFHLYGIRRADLDYIMETFPIVKRKDIAEHGSYRTKELILDVYDRMARAIEAGEPYQTILDPAPADSSLCQPPRERG